MVTRKNKYVLSTNYAPGVFIYSTYTLFTEFRGQHYYPCFADMEIEAPRNGGVCVLSPGGSLVLFSLCFSSANHLQTRGLLEQVERVTELAMALGASDLP